ASFDLVFRSLDYRRNVWLAVWSLTRKSQESDHPRHHNGRGQGKAQAPPRALGFLSGASQLRNQILRSRSLPRIEGQALFDQLTQSPVELRGDFSQPNASSSLLSEQPGRKLPAVHLRGFATALLGRLAERMLAAEEFIQQNAERIDVGFFVERPDGWHAQEGLDLFRGHEWQRAA